MLNSNETISDVTEPFNPSQILTLAGTAQLLQMFDLLSDTLFWIKDINSRMVHVNQALVRHFGVKSASQILGLTDYDFSPRHIAKQFITDDLRVMNGKTVSERLELNYLSNGEYGWFITSKRALYDPQQQVIGTYGSSQLIEQSSEAFTNLQAIKTPVEYIRSNYGQDINIQALAEQVHLSLSALERRFKKYLHKTPKQFLNEVRLENARKLLIETQLPIATIGSECGFADHSYFCRKFSQLFDEVPSTFRKKHRQHNVSRC